MNVVIVDDDLNYLKKIKDSFSIENSGNVFFRFSNGNFDVIKKFIDKNLTVCFIINSSKAELIKKIVRYDSDVMIIVVGTDKDNVLYSEQVKVVDINNHSLIKKYIMSYIDSNNKKFQKNNIERYNDKIVFKLNNFEVFIYGQFVHFTSIRAKRILEEIVWKSLDNYKNNCYDYIYEEDIVDEVFSDVSSSSLSGNKRQAFFRLFKTLENYNCKDLVLVKENSRKKQYVLNFKFNNNSVVILE